MRRAYRTMRFFLLTLAWQRRAVASHPYLRRGFPSVYESWRISWDTAGMQDYREMCRDLQAKVRALGHA
jgi:hypothetical protein